MAEDVNYISKLPTLKLKTGALPSIKQDTTTNNLVIPKISTSNLKPDNKIVVTTSSHYNETNTTNDTKDKNIDFQTFFINTFNLLHPIYLCFFNDNLIMIRYQLISRLVFLITSDFLFNSFYYSDRYISHTFNHGYSFGYEVDKAIASSVTSIVVNILLKLLIIDLKVYNDKSKSIQMRKIFNYIYYTSIFILTIFSWSCVTAFCSVYQHNQVHLIYCVLFSLGFDIIIIPLLIIMIYILFDCFLRKYQSPCLPKLQTAIIKYY